MGSDGNAIKRHYDISMSRRTRKPAVHDFNEGNKYQIPSDYAHKYVPLDKGGEGDADHKSLKQLIINGDIGEEENVLKMVEESKGRNSLEQHFSQEKQLQIVRKQEGSLQGNEGTKLKKLVRRYAKVLGQIMKVKRDSHKAESRKKPVLHLKT